MIKEREERAEGSEMEGFEDTHIVILEQDIVFSPFFLEIQHKKLAMAEGKRMWDSGFFS